MKNKFVFLFLFIFASFFGGEKIDVLFYLQDAGETYALIPVVQELMEQKKSIQVIAEGTASELLPGWFKRLEIRGFSPGKSFPRDGKMSPDAIQSLIDAVEPRLVVTGVAYFSQGQVLDTFRSRGVPSIAYWDNLSRLGETPYFKTAEEVAKHATSLLVPTYSMKDAFTVQAVTVGQPTLEAWEKEVGQMDPIALRQQMGICTCKNVMLFIGGYGEEYEQSLRLFAETMESNDAPSDLLVLIQPHPKNKEGAVEQAILESRDIPFRILRNEITTQQAVALSTMLCCHQSTVAFQALAAGKPVIHFIPDSQLFTSVLIEKGMAQKVVHPEEFKQAWDRAIEAATRFDFFEMIGAPRNSARFCAETLRELL